MTVLDLSNFSENLVWMYHLCVVIIVNSSFILIGVFFWCQSKYFMLQNSSCFSIAFSIPKVSCHHLESGGLLLLHCTPGHQDIPGNPSLQVNTAVCNRHLCVWYVHYFYFMSSNCHTLLLDGCFLQKTWLNNNCLHSCHSKIVQKPIEGGWGALRRVYVLFFFRRTGLVSFDRRHFIRLG